MTCSIDGCVRPIKYRDMCGAHYERARRRGELEPLPTPGLLERFWAKVDTHGPEHELGRCWTWTAHRDQSGYGRFNVGLDHIEGAHRIAYTLTIRLDIPEGMTIDHLCRRGADACVNPAHMEVVTRAENTARANTANKLGVRKKSVCDYGHPLTPENSYMRPDGARACRVCRFMMSHRDHVKRGLNCRCINKAEALALTLAVA